MVARGSDVRPRAGRRVRLAGLGVAATLLTLLTGCDIDRAFSFGFPQGGITPQANRMYDLWIGAVIAALAVGVFVWALIFWCIFRYRKRGEELPVQTRYNMPMEILYTVTPVLIVSVLFFYTALVQTDVTDTDKPADITVEVVAFKWNWQFNYVEPGTQSDNGTVVSTTGSSDVIPVLVLPTGQPVRFELSSNDVIHSFWVPQLIFKRDVFPGEQAKTEFVVDELQQEGAYVGRCAELCGAYHAMMNFELRVVSPEKYERFIAQMQAGRSTQEALSAIGEEPYAVTTDVFDTRREAQNFNN
ncbi:MAG TPA: cytochrome c oxidase subunit II [Micromonosporaceae bacterium]